MIGSTQTKWYLFFKLIHHPNDKWPDCLVKLSLVFTTQQTVSRTKQSSATLNPNGNRQMQTIDWDFELLRKIVKLDVISKQ